MSATSRRDTKLPHRHTQPSACPPPVACIRTPAVACCSAPTARRWQTGISAARPRAMVLPQIVVLISSCRWQLLSPPSDIACSRCKQFFFVDPPVFRRFYHSRTERLSPILSGLSVGRRPSLRQNGRSAQLAGSIAGRCWRTPQCHTRLDRLSVGEGRGGAGDEVTPHRLSPARHPPQSITLFGSAVQHSNQRFTPKSDSQPGFQKSRT